MAKYPHLDKKVRQMAKSKNWGQWCDDLPDGFKPQNEREEQLVKSDVPIEEIRRLRAIRS